MDRPQLIRRLRIAASVFFAMVAVALCVLWVRSYRVAEAILWRVSNVNGYQAISTYGTIMLSKQQLKPLNLMWPKFDIEAIQDPSFNTKRNAPNLLGFRIDHVPLCDILTVPYWFLVFIAAISGPIPWFRSLSPRFSLRTLLIATTLVAVALGLGVWTAG